MNAPDWLVAQPIAHRGLHDPGKGIAENSNAAARAARERGFAIECDVQLSSDGEAFVFHDSKLDRLTSAQGPVSGRTARELAQIELKIGGERIPSFAEFLGVIAGATPLICEIKSRFDGDVRLARRAVAASAAYSGPLAFKSFDPEIVAYLRTAAIQRPIGIVAEASYEDAYFAEMSAEQKRSAAAFLHIEKTQPDFLSWSIKDLPHAAPSLFRALSRNPVLTWTVRTEAQKGRAKKFADQIVFEGEPD